MFEALARTLYKQIPYKKSQIAITTLKETAPLNLVSSLHVQAGCPVV